MTDPLGDRLVIGISTRALFDLDAENAIYELQGLAAYRAYQREHENDPLAPGTGFALVRGLLGVNGQSPSGPLVEVLLLSRNDADSSMRVFNSIEALGLAITRGAFRGGRDPWPFLPAFKCDLFLSAEPGAVDAALAQGTPAALVLPPPKSVDSDLEDEVRIAFDGDSVLFDEESDRIFERDGAEAFFEHEKVNVDVPLSAGPFRPFLDGLAKVQSHFPDNASPIRTALVTARNAPAHRRVVNTLRAWKVRIDEAYFLGGVDKFEVVSRLRPHLFLDDQLANLERAAREVPSAHVPARSEQIPMFKVAVADRAPSNASPPKTRGTASGKGIARPPLGRELPSRLPTIGARAGKVQERDVLPESDPAEGPPVESVERVANEP